MKQLTPTIGMEIHVELKTKSKMFCGCPADHFAAKPNTQTCPVCLGMPGALPVPNKQAVDWTILIGLGLQCHIAHNSKFDRKHYFYPDLPKGYQISQYDEPLCYQGLLKTSFGDVRITRVHLEEDTAKLQHITIPSEVEGPKKVTLVDFNRSSVPLVEIVSEPDIVSAKQAKEYAQKIHQLVQYLGVSDADMEKGSMRAEANISWGLDLGYKVEVKNINSFRFLEKAIEFELARQKKLLDQGITPKQETRGWSEAKNETYSQRSKESAEDYRYFPEPDIPPMIFSDSEILKLKHELPKLPDEIKTVFTQTYGIREDYADSLISDNRKAQFAETCFSLAKKQQLSPNDIAKILVNKGSKLPSSPNEIIAEAVKVKAVPTASTNEIEAWVQQAISSNPDIVAKYQSGKTAVIGVLVGEVMKQAHGQADPQTIVSKLQSALKP